MTSNELKDVESSKNETVLARKLKKTLELKLENDVDTVAALKELSTFFQVRFCFWDVYFLMRFDFLPP
jgi:hypothetical protein